MLKLKKTLADTYGKLFQVQRALIKDLEHLNSICQQYQLKEVHDSKPIIENYQVSEYDG